MALTTALISTDSVLNLRHLQTDGPLSNISNPLIEITLSKGYDDELEVMADTTFPPKIIDGKINVLIDGYFSTIFKKNAVISIVDTNVVSTWEGWSSLSKYSMTFTVCETPISKPNPNAITMVYSGHIKAGSRVIPDRSAAPRWVQPSIFELWILSQFPTKKKLLQVVHDALPHISISTAQTCIMALEQGEMRFKPDYSAMKSLISSD
ncbi:hypothetical protein PRIPAC_70134 [Pristionchus pacificus]|uniref:Uncharacterized protein n=1 Tax=Pristionchus pacificus TaxID=54126 RepID=A0A2A6C898_PRIPA|nr:hypothetical protein PRIPAC_70134 [Pristionchus pacificus]|eukprot:PDM74435.1 hypothetical protein PRIPAC_41791 [Pristionchus pacificus]